MKSSSLKLVILMSAFAMIQGGQDWKVKITNNAEFDVTVEHASDLGYNCWHFEDFGQKKHISSGSSHIFYSMESNAIISGCGGQGHKTMWVEIKEFQYRDAQNPHPPKDRKSRLLLQRKEFKVPKDIPCPKENIPNRCPKKEITFTNCKNHYSRQHAHDVPQNLAIDIFKGKLSGDRSSDDCYIAVDVVVGNFK